MEEWTRRHETEISSGATATDVRDVQWNGRNG